MRAWTRSLVIVMVTLTGTIGLWAGFWPKSFYEHGPIPLLDTGWVAMLPPYNEHLVRDYGFMNLAVTAISVVAAIVMSPLIVRTAATAVIAFGLPHTLFHSFHLEHMSTADAILLTTTNSLLTILLPATVFAMAGQGVHGGPLSPPRSNDKTSHPA